MTEYQLTEKLKDLDLEIIAYTTALVDWDPEVMEADETGSRTPYYRDAIEDLLTEL